MQTFTTKAFLNQNPKVKIQLEAPLDNDQREDSPISLSISFDHQGDI